MSDTPKVYWLDEQSKRNDSAKLADSELPEFRQFIRIGRILTTVDLAGALEEASKLAIARFSVLGRLTSEESLGTTAFRMR